jgi:large subunit ribosomal protein L3
MTALWDAKGNRLPVTILQVSQAQVVSVKTLAKHGYWAVQIGVGLRSPRNVTKAMLGHFAAAGVAPKAKVGEFRVKDETGLLPVGRKLLVFCLIFFRFRDQRNAFSRRPVC